MTLRKAYEDLVDAAASHDVLRIVDVDLAFHATIVSMLHSSRIDEFYAGLLVELRFYLTVLSLEDREFESPDDILTDHREILEAIESGDPVVSHGARAEPHRAQRASASSRSCTAATDHVAGRAGMGWPRMCAYRPRCLLTSSRDCIAT